MRLKVKPTEPDPEVRSLAPGETVNCTWDAQVYQRPSIPPLASLSLMEELAPVPRGQYQLRLNYAFSAEEIAPKTCSWDQRAWQDPGKQGRARFEEYDPALGALQAPPGSYRFMMVYYFADPDTFVSEGERLREAQRVVTEQFAVTE